MRISVFAIFCLPVGITPSFALPSEHPSENYLRFQSRVRRVVSDANEVSAMLARVRAREASEASEARARARASEASEASEARKRAMAMVEESAAREAEERRKNPKHSCSGCSSEMA
ncbi:hypothetical protein F5148DRAFT_104645 [Russula earlei]|uniref:Uncharacterized protein n=1 Tax=Russula earlei TaxID=71964 RepID=A0ACC0TQY2_9AGAM|nr:hypothetical protein F5148DRAFT_104645 [Russula earlei]